MAPQLGYVPPLMIRQGQPVAQASSLLRLIQPPELPPRIRPRPASRSSHCAVLFRPKRLALTKTRMVKPAPLNIERALFKNSTFCGKEERPGILLEKCGLNMAVTWRVALIARAHTERIAGGFRSIRPGIP